jgi:cell wall-associated NlpC family hydrolase
MPRSTGLDRVMAVGPEPTGGGVINLGAGGASNYRTVVWRCAVAGSWLLLVGFVPPTQHVIQAGLVGLHNWLGPLADKVGHQHRAGPRLSAGPMPHMLVKGGIKHAVTDGVAYIVVPSAVVAGVALVRQWRAIRAPGLSRITKPSIWEPGRSGPALWTGSGRERLPEARAGPGLHVRGLLLRCPTTRSDDAATPSIGWSRRRGSQARRFLPAAGPLMRSRTYAAAGLLAAALVATPASRDAVARVRCVSCHNSSTGGARAVTDARRYLGVPYVWGGTDPATGLDCSGFTQRVYADLGVQLPRNSGEQAHAGKPVHGGLKNARPGDLLFWAYPSGTVHHVAIYEGNGRVIEAPQAGENVSERDVYSGVIAIRRIQIGGTK